MLKVVTTLFLIFFLLFAVPTHATDRSLTINIISRDLDNQAGKEVDAAILEKELKKLGHQVQFYDYLNKTASLHSADINIFLAQFKTSLFSKAKLNWFIPNPDFCTGKSKDLRKFDLILCKTEESLRIFQPIGRETYYLGFTSRDCYDPLINKDFSKHIHVAGKSIMKGTEEVLQAWKNHSKMPHLTLIKNTSHKLVAPMNVTIITKRVPSHTLLQMQNKCGIHVCPSKTEGFGHYLMEAMSAGAVVITTDAPPMNEFIKDKRCLVRYRKTSHKAYATTFIVDAIELGSRVKALQQLSTEELRRIGECNREEYLRRENEFKESFQQLMKKAIHDLEE